MALKWKDETLPYDEGCHPRHHIQNVQFGAIVTNCCMRALYDFPSSICVSCSDRGIPICVQIVSVYKQPKMSSNYFSLRDLFRMGSSHKRHRLGRAPRKSNHQHQVRATRTTYPSSNTYQYPEYASPRQTCASQHPRTKRIDALTCVDSTDRPYLSNLPPEIHLSIFDSLDPVSSTCLGLTSRKFYPMHRGAHKHVPLYDTGDKGMPLCCLLKDWAPRDLVLDSTSGKLMTRERYSELGRERVRRERERDARVGWEREYSYGYGYGEGRTRGRERCLHPGYESYYEVAKPKLQRKRRLDRHDIWYSGRRY